MKCCAIGVAAVCIAPVKASAAAVPCGPSSARTLAQSAQARIYQVRPPVGVAADWISYGCLRGHRRVRFDDPAAGDRGELVSTTLVPDKPAAVAGPWAAFALETSDSGGYTEATYLDVQLVDLRDGTARTSYGSLAFQPSEFNGTYFGGITDLVLRPTGALAWIGARRVIAFDARGNRRLDRRAQRRSLRLEGRRIEWRSRDGTRRRASLRGTPPRDGDQARSTGTSSGSALPTPAPGRSPTSPSGPRARWWPSVTDVSSASTRVGTCGSGRRP